MDLRAQPANGASGKPEEQDDAKDAFQVANRPSGGTAVGPGREDERREEEPAGSLDQGAEGGRFSDPG